MHATGYERWIWYSGYRMPLNNGASSPGLPEEQVRQALERILASEPFVRAKRSSALLGYLVRRAVAGDAGNLKEYTVAVEVFERDSSFDPRVDSLVRVEASRLRNRLRTYYEGPGADDPVRIDLAAGSYHLVFRPADGNGEGKPAFAPPPAWAPNSWIRARRWLMAAAVVLAALGAAVYYLPLKRVANPELTDLRRVSLENGVYAYTALAPGRDWIVYSSDRGSQKHLKLWRQPLDGGAPLQLTFGDHDDINPVISPDSRWIAFESKRDGESIQIMPSAGGASRRVVWFGRGPRFASDGEWLIYWVRSPISGFGKVYLVPLNQPKEPVQLAPEFDDAHEPVWTPDGKHVLFCGTRRTRGGPGEEHNLWVAPVSGGPAINTGAFELIRGHGLDPHAQMFATTSFEFHNQKLIFAADLEGTTGLWQLPVSPTSWRATGAPRRLAEETTAAMHPSVRGRTIAFTRLVHDVDIWSAPLEASQARVSGALRREAASPLEDMSSSMSSSGHVLAFFSGPPGRTELRKKEFPAGRETSLGRIAGFVNRLRVSADGRTSFYRVLEGEGIKRQAIYETNLNSGERRLVCGNCGSPTQVTPSARLVVYETGSAVARLAAVQVADGRKWDFLSHSHHSVQAGRVSPDERWLAFQLNRSLDGIQIYVAPFRQATRVEPSEWVPVTGPEGVNQEPWWSHDGRYLYYLSDRDRRRCVWASPFDTASGRPGAPQEVLALHEPRLTPLSYLRRAPFHIGLSIAADKIVLSLAEVNGSVWTGQLRP